MIIISSTIIFVIVSKVMCHEHLHGLFARDMWIDKHEFPPRILKPPKGLPYGHLRPLGYQRPSDGRITLLAPNDTDILSNFYKNCVEPRKACLIKEHWDPPAHASWKDKAMARKYPLYRVTVHQQETMESTIMTLAKFIYTFHQEMWKLETVLPEDMKKDLTMPAVFQCPTQLEYLDSVNLWMTSGPHATKLYHENVDELICPLSGRADFILYAKQTRSLFRIKEYPKHSGRGFSPIDVHQINGYEQSGVQSTAWHHATALENDCVYLPAGLIRHMRFYGRFLAVVFKVSERPKYEPCDNVTPDVNKTLDNYDTMWTIDSTGLKIPNVKENGTGVGWNETVVKKYLESLMRNKNRIFIEEFNDFIPAALYKNLFLLEDSMKFWKRMDEDMTGNIHRDLFEIVDKEVFEDMAAQFEKRRVWVTKREKLKLKDEL